MKSVLSEKSTRLSDLVQAWMLCKYSCMCVFALCMLLCVFALCMLLCVAVIMILFLHR